jgi:hypothetical protein
LKEHPRLNQIMKTKVSWIAISTMLLIGCASDPGSKASTSGIRTASIEQRVDTPGAMHYGVQLQGGIINSLSGALSDSIGRKGVERMQQVMAAHRIDIADLVLGRVTQSLRSRPQPQIVDGDGDGVFLAQVTQHGFEISNPFSSKRFPFVLLRLELRDHAGKTIWRNENKPMHLESRGVGASYDEYEAHPERLRKDWELQIDAALRHLLAAPK